MSTNYTKRLKIPRSGGELGVFWFSFILSLTTVVPQITRLLRPMMIQSLPNAYNHQQKDEIGNCYSSCCRESNPLPPSQQATERILVRFIPNRSSHENPFLSIRYFEKRTRIEKTKLNRIQPRSLGFTSHHATTQPPTQPPPTGRTNSNSTWYSIELMAVPSERLN